MPIDYQKYPGSTGVYRIYNKTTMKSYVGSSLNISKRLSYHFYLLKNNTSHSPRLQSSYNKHGKQVFRYEILELCGESELREKEKYWINKLNSVSGGYNCSDDTHCPTRGKKHSLKTKKIMSEILKKRWIEKRNELLEISLKNLSEATKKRIGSKNTDEHNSRISQSNKGRKMSEKTKKLMSDVQLKNPCRYWLGKRRSNEDIEKFRKAHTGKVFSKETREKMSLSRKGKPPHNKNKTLKDGKYVSL